MERVLSSFTYARSRLPLKKDLHANSADIRVNNDIRVSRNK